MKTVEAMLFVIVAAGEATPSEWRQIEPGLSIEIGRAHV
jgi:hypothetical protein